MTTLPPRQQQLYTLIQQAHRAAVADMNNTMLDCERGATPQETAARLALFASQIADRLNGAANQLYAELLDVQHWYALYESKIAEQAQIINLLRETHPDSVALAEHTAVESRAEYQAAMQHIVANGGRAPLPSAAPNAAP